MTKYKCLYDITGRIEDVATFLVPLKDLPKQEQRCEYCDGTGDVHDQTGEWRGVCVCEAGAKQEQGEHCPHPCGDIKCAVICKRYSEQEQGEPVAWYIREKDMLTRDANWVAEYPDMCEPLYTTPQQRTWVVLTDEEIRDAIKHSEKVTTEHAGWVAEQRLIWGRSIEAKLKEKNT